MANMAKIEERVKKIGASILTQAEQESRELIDKANHIKEQEIHLYEDQVIDEMFQKLQKETAQLRAETVRGTAAAQVAEFRAILRRREELTLQVFSAVKTRLFAYVATPAYAEMLLRDVEALRDRWDHSYSTVSLREADLPLAEKIRGLLGSGCGVEASASIKIGGFRLINTAAGILVDETLDARLQAQRPWLLEHCGMKISE